jgi:prepilin-type N-terminal cleavage/methylation domain-containing protein
MYDRSFRRLGFSLIELLVVIAIIAILVGLILPAVQHARESANLTVCKNNLKQIGIALQNYHDSKGRFPVGYYDPTPWPKPDNGPGFGWAAFILPYMEQGNVYKLINFKKDVGDPANAAVRTMFLKMYFCPSDVPLDPPDNTFTVTDGMNQSWDMAQCSYVACNGNDGVDDFSTPPHTGSFMRAIKGFRIPEIVDGLSNTMFVADRTVRLSYSSWIGAPTGSLNPFLLNPGNFGAETTFVMFHAGMTGPNTPGVYDADSTMTPHVSGAPVVFGDGSVHLISTQISIPVWMALATRSGYEVISQDEF